MPRFPEPGIGRPNAAPPAAVAKSLVNIGSAPSETGSTGDTFFVKNDGTVHRYTPQGISASVFGMTGDAVGRGFTSVSGSTLTSTGTITSADIGKLITIPGAGADDNTGFKDGFTTTISNVVGTTVTLTNPVITTVNSGTNLVALVGTDNTTALNNFATALPGKRGFIPPGNYMYTLSPDFGTLLGSPFKGMWLEGAGGSAQNSNASAATQLWYAGPVNSTANGAGAHALLCGNANSNAFGWKLRGFSLRCLRALAVSTTVNGAGQTINTTPSSLTVTSTTGFPQFGRAIVGGSANVEITYTGISGNQLTGCTITSGNAFTATNGGVVRSVNAALFTDGLNNSDIQDINIASYFDNNNSAANVNCGIGTWFNNFLNGQLLVNRVNSQGFAGNYGEGMRIGTCAAGYAGTGNSGNSIFTNCVKQTCGKYGIHVIADGGGPLDGILLDSPKVLGLGSTSVAGYFFDGQQIVGSTVNTPHSEGYPVAISVKDSQSITVNGLYCTYNQGTVGDGSAAVSLSGVAGGVTVHSGVWKGTSAGGNGTFDNVVLAGSSTVGNRVQIKGQTGLSTPGTTMFNNTGTQNVFVDMNNLVVGDAGSGQQTGVLAPDSRGIGSGANLVAVANQAYFARFVPTRYMSITKIAFVVSTAATNNDNCDVGIYQVVTGSLTKIATAGSTAGKVNAGGVQTINLTCTLIPGQVYYAAFAYGTVGGTAATIQARGYNATNNAAFFGSGVGQADYLQLASGFPLGNSPAPSLSGTSVPLIAVRES